jgi:Transposase DDE domain
VFLLSRMGRRTGIYYIDSTALPVCHNRRIDRHTVFTDLAARGKTSIGWFFGFKLHLGPVEIHREWMIAAPRKIMAAKLVSVLSLRMAMRLNSFSLQKKFSIRWRHL